MASVENWQHNSFEGSITEVERETACKLLAKGTHRLADDDEKRSYYKETAKKRQIRALADSKDSSTAIERLTDQIGMVLNTVAPPAAAPPPRQRPGAPKPQDEDTRET